MNQNPKGGLQTPRDAYYTGKDINATAGSRNTISADLKVGDIVQLDIYDHDGYGLGRAVAKPTAAQVGQLFVVTAVPDGSKRGGPISVTPNGIVMARGNATTNAITVGALLSPYTGNLFHLEVSAGTTVAHMKARVSGTINEVKPCAVAMEALASGTGLIKVMFGDSIGGGIV